MTRVLHIHLPGLAGDTLLDGIDHGYLKTFGHLVERGEAGFWRSEESFPSREITVATGGDADEHQVFYKDQERPDGFGTEPLTRHALGASPWWEDLDAQGLSCCVVNWCATRHGYLANGAVVADAAFRVSARTDDLWGIPPGSVLPLSLAPLIKGLRLHPEFLSEEQISTLTGCPASERPVDDKTLMAIRVLSEMSSVHSVVTHFLAAGKHDLISACYMPFLELTGHFPPLDSKAPSGVLGQVVILVDQFLARLCELLPHDARLIVTGGGDETQFVIKQGPGYEPDRLLDAATGFEAVGDIIRECFDTSDIQGKGAGPGVGFPSADAWIERFERAGLARTSPTSPQVSLAAHCSEMVERRKNDWLARSR